MKFKAKALATAVTLSFAVPAAAQTADPATDPAMTNPTPVENDDDDFPWGLLGLLGLAGLMGLKRRDRDDDVRRTGTGTGSTNR